MKTLQGIAVSSGITIGEAMVIDNGRRRVTRRYLEASALVPFELSRLDKATETTASQIAKNRDSVAKELGAEYGHIFGAHLQILSDKKLRKEIEDHIRKSLYTAEYAVETVFQRHADLLRNIQGSGISERSNDIIDIENRLLRQLMGVRKEGLSHLERPVLVLASNLTPSETANLDRKNVLGFATEEGGLGSHTAIVASALQIPAVLGIGAFLAQVKDGDRVIIDGNNGLLLLQPDQATLDRYEEEIRRAKSFHDLLSHRTEEPAVTKDGVPISVLGNIEFPYEAKICLENGAEGIGLYRTEFLYLTERLEDLPTEETHFEAYRQVAEAMNGKWTTIRTFDLGADKLPSGLTSRQTEKNPFMGIRSIRLSLRKTDLFRSQLRAILRASAYGKLQVMFPLISTIMEFRMAKMLFADVCEELYDKGIPFDQSIPVGMMVEVPATVIMLGTFVREVDFFSIGTNDLAQYTLAVDRSNPEVSYLYNAEDPALIRLVRQAIKVAALYDRPISLCGQMSSNPIYTMLLIGLGLRKFSVTPVVIPEIKELCRRVSVGYCREVANRVLLMEKVLDIRNYLKRETEKILGSDRKLPDAS